MEEAETFATVFYSGNWRPINLGLSHAAVDEINVSKVGLLDKNRKCIFFPAKPLLQEVPFSMTFQESQVYFSPHCLGKEKAARGTFSSERTQKALFFALLCKIIGHSLPFVPIGSKNIKNTKLWPHGKPSY